MKHAARFGIAGLAGLAGLTALIPEASAQACFWKTQYVCNAWGFCQYFYVWFCG